MSDVQVPRSLLMKRTRELLEGIIQHRALFARNAKKVTTSGAMLMWLRDFQTVRFSTGRDTLLMEAIGEMVGPGDAVITGTMDHPMRYLGLDYNQKPEVFFCTLTDIRNKRAIPPHIRRVFVCVQSESLEEASRFSEKIYRWALTSEAADARLFIFAHW